jgi:hypothetical protein
MNGYYHLRGPALKPGAAGWTQDTNELVIHYLSEVYTCVYPSLRQYITKWLAVWHAITL